MAESTLTYSLTEIENAVGHHLGFTRTGWSTEQQADIDECVNAGEHNFYHPPAAEKESPYVWSFLRPATTLAIASGTSAYDLQDNFSRMHGGFTHAAALDLPMVRVVSEEAIRNLQARDPQSEDPLYAAVRQKAFDGATGQRWEVIFYPTPNAIRTLTYRPEVHPDAMSVASPYPMGGMAHSATLMESCLAAAEQYKDDQPGAHTARFITLLRSSIKYDRKMDSPEGTVYQVRTDTDTLIVSIFNLYEVIGLRAGWGAAYDSWGYDEKKQAKFIIDAGLRMFYSPPPLPKQPDSHRWNFLRPEATMDTVTGTDDYTLPTDFGGLESDLIYSGSDSLYRRVKMSAPSDVEMMRSGPGALASGAPEYGAIRPKTTDGTVEQTMELMLYPNPDAVYTMIYHYHRLMAPLTETRIYPYGSREHGNLMILAVLAQMDIHGPSPDPKRRKMQEFMLALAASVAIDRKSTAQHLGLNRGDTYDYYQDLTPYRIKTVTYVP